MAGGMSRDAAYHFLRAGRYLERADMTSRIVDVGTANVFPWGTAGRDESGLPRESDPYESILWMDVLRSLNALQMYRRQVPERICAEEVVAFLLQDENFPRAVANCLQALQSCLRHLPHNEAAVDTATAAIGLVSQASITARCCRTKVYTGSLTNCRSNSICCTRSSTPVGSNRRREDPCLRSRSAQLLSREFAVALVPHGGPRRRRQ